jgi:large subunit ribosomal protein L9
MVATPSNKKILAENLKQRAFKEAKIKQDAEAFAETLNKIEGLKIAAKASETGKIFGSVNTTQIADAIKAQFDVEVDRKKISIVGDAIKEVGTHKVIVSVYKEIKSEITFEVYAE